MKKLLFLFLLISSAATAQHGFLITFKDLNKREIEVIKVRTFAQVDSVFQTKYNYLADSELLMSGTTYFVIENAERTFYCEMKELKANGKLSRKRMKKQY